MSEFPSPHERTVASALLLLSTRPFVLSLPELESDRKESKRRHEDSFSFGSKSYGGESLSLVSRGSRSSASSLSTDGSSHENRDHCVVTDSLAARYNLMELKSVRKPRSKVFCSSVGFKLTDIKPVAELSSASDESKEESCLSSGSSYASSVGSRSDISVQQRRDTVGLVEPQKKLETCGSAPIRRRAEAILKLLSGSCSSEVKIRQALGDSPDTSKALRMLLKMEEIKRSGTGGRHDPFIYMIA